MSETKKLLLVGFGNEFRKDDGLGIKLLDYLPNVPQMKVQELSFEMAELVKDYDIVIFVDASIEGDDLSFKKIEPEPRFSPLTHHLSPEELLLWTRSLYQKASEFYLLSIRGYDFDFGEGLSEEAEENLAKAVSYLKEYLKNLEDDH